MDEPCSALDPVATLKIEELIGELKQVGDDRDRHPQHAAGGAGRRPDRVHARRRAGRGRSDRQAVHQPRRRAHRAVRDREVRLMAPETRSQYHEELGRLEASGLGGLDLVHVVAGAHPGGDRAPGRRAGAARDRRRRPDRRPLPRGSPGADHAAGDAVAGGDRPAPDLGAAARAEERRADGRPVREHLQGDPADRQRAAGRRGDGAADPHDGPPGADPDQPGEAGFRGAQRRDGPRPGPPGRRRSTTSTASASGWRWRSATTPTGANGR